MSTLGFTDQRARLRRILENSIEGALYDSSETEERTILVLHAHRRDGRRVTVRFRGVESSDATQEPQAGDSLSLRSVDPMESGCMSLIRFLPLFRLPPFGSPLSDSARVRIDAGAARLDIVCQDAEWWEDTGTA